MDQPAQPVNQRQAQDVAQRQAHRCNPPHPRVYEKQAKNAEADYQLKDSDIFHVL